MLQHVVGHVRAAFRQREAKCVAWSDRQERDHGGRLPVARGVAGIGALVIFRMVVVGDVQLELRPRLRPRFVKDNAAGSRRIIARVPRNAGGLPTVFAVVGVRGQAEDSFDHPPGRGGFVALGRVGRLAAGVELILRGSQTVSA